MAKSKLFLVSEKSGADAAGGQAAKKMDEFVLLEESGYVTEETLQRYLGDCPDLLPGDQISPDALRRWLLVSREMPVPAAEDEGARWSLDHLFLDQEGVPSFVECKRATDTRLRREVVAQMLDYAANGAEYWTVGQIKEAAARTVEGKWQNLKDAIAELVGAEPESLDPEEFWRKVEANLKEGRLRLIFVADNHPRELRRLIEFLNEKMQDIEVLGVEVKQFEGAAVPGRKALVPRVIGARATKQPPPTPARFAGAPDFLARCAPEARDFFDWIQQDARAHGYMLYWGSKGFSIRYPLGSEGGLISFAYGYLPDTSQVYFDRHGLLQGERATRLREDLLRHGILREVGECTLQAQVTGQILPSLKQVWVLMRDAVAQVRSEPPAPAGLLG